MRTKQEISITCGLAELGARMQKEGDVYQVQHDWLFATIYTGLPFFEADYVATRAMSASETHGPLLGQGGDVGHGLNSEVSLVPASYDMNADPRVLPDKDGDYQVALPGTTLARSLRRSGAGRRHQDAMGG